MNGLRIILFLMVIVLSLMGCSKGNSILTPALEKELQDYYTESIEIFGPSTAGDMPGFFHDIALSSISSIPWYQEPLAPVETPAVTLSRQDNTPDHPFKPIFRFLDTGGYGAGADPLYVTRLFQAVTGSHALSSACCKLKTVSAHGNASSLVVTSTKRIAMRAYGLKLDLLNTQLKATRLRYHLRFPLIPLQQSASPLPLPLEEPEPEHKNPPSTLPPEFQP